jgi:hypothetical protein
MQSWSVLPDVILRPVAPISDTLRQMGCNSYRSIARYLSELPYGRNSDRADFRLVLSEQRGTCSTKHALLAAVATEQSLRVSLVVGIYDMTEANTPGVGSVLNAHRLNSLPEAHCYLVYAGNRVDVTRSGVSSGSPITSFQREWEITPIQIGSHKRALHQEYLREWILKRRDISMSFDDLWHVREACILALGAA